jgi:hypothetical protein
MLQTYTQNGYSHSSLKKKVKELIKSEKLTRTQARKKVAESIGYSNWKKILIEPQDIERNEFFSDGFSRKAHHQALFETYLKNESREDTLHNYRRFLVQQYKIIDSLKKDEPHLVFLKEINFESATKELLLRTSDFGPESLLPHNLPDYLLSAMKETLSDWLHNPIIEETNDASLLIKAIFDGVVLLKATAVSLEDPSHPEKFKFAMDEVVESMEMYSLQLHLESIGRKTKIQITKPTLKTVLDPDAIHSLTFPKEVVDLMREELD